MNIISRRFRRAPRPVKSLRELRRLSSKRSTWMLVVALVVLGLGPLITLAVVAGSASRDRTERLVTGAASASAVALSQHIRGLTDLVRAYGERDSVRQAMSSPDGLTSLSGTLDELSASHRDITLAFVTDADGVVGSIVPETPSVVGHNFAYRDWYQGAMNMQSGYVSEAYEAEGPGHGFGVAVAAPVYDPQDPERVAGIIVAVYDLGAIQRFVDDYSQAQHVAITVTDQHGTVIAKTGAPPHQLVSVASDPHVAAALRGETGAGVSDEAGPAREYAFVPVADTGWTVTAEIAFDAAYSNPDVVKSEVALAMVLILVALGFSIALVVVQQRRRSRAEGELRDATALLAAIVENNPQAIAATDAGHRFVMVNKAAEHLFGVPSEDLVGHSPLDLGDRLPSGFGWEEDSAVLDAGVPVEIPVKVITTRDGSDRFIHTIMVPISPGGKDDADLLLRISEDITERVQGERVVRQARQDAEDANLAKNEFLSRMSHELRTPLNAVIGFAQLLEQDGLSPDQRDSARQIRHGGQHLLDLINEVLDISLIETGRLRVSLEPVRIGDVIDESLSLVGSLARSRSIQIPTSHHSECEMHVQGDRQRLKQALLNLLTNAVKYNKDHGSVDVACYPTSNGRVRVAVTDSGPGIPPDKLTLVFSPFERLGAESSDVEGTGLGLALTRGLVAAMGGEIGVDSEIGRGTTFWLELNRATAPADAVPLTIMPNPHRPVANATGHGKTVLYIEDNLSNIKLVERILASTPQFELVVAMHGELGIDLAKTRQPDLILLDLNLPDMGGQEILVRLHAEPTTKNIPVVVVSADATSQQIRRLMAGGATGYLTKPIDVNEFRRTLTTHLEASDTHDELARPAIPQAREADVRVDGSPVVATAGTVTALNDDAVHSLQELFTDQVDIDDFLATLDRELSARSQSLREAIAAADPSGVRANAHALRGMLGNIGATQASVLCASMEHNPEQSREELGEIKARLDDSIEHAQSEIHARFQDNR